MAEPIIAEGKERKPRRWGTLLWEIVETIVLALVIYWVVTLVVYNFRVVGSSMEPSLKDGQYLLVNKAAYFHLDTDLLRRLIPFGDFGDDEVFYFFGAPQRGEIVVFEPPRNSSAPYIKRIIGVPGDVIEVRDGSVWVNGIRLREPYLREQLIYTLPPQEVPEGHYFVLGDNRNNSSDSHIWGLVPQDNIVGRAWLSYWPISRWGLVRNYRLVLP